MRLLAASQYHCPVVFHTGLPHSDQAQVGETSSKDDSPKEKNIVDTALLIFPPSSVPGGSSTVSVHALITGEGCMSAPTGHWIVYLIMPNVELQSDSAEILLKPYLDALLTLTVASGDATQQFAPPFSLFYFEHPDSDVSADSSSESFIHIPTSWTYLTETADSAASTAEEVFWKAIGVLKAAGVKPHVAKDSGVDSGEVESFWPPLGDMEESVDEW